jgi:ssDNA-binding Zn-finger/Zn-ribbon topoisomerase 1
MKHSKVKQKCKFCGKKVLKSNIAHIDGFPACKGCFEKRKRMNYLEREGITPKKNGTWLDDWVLKLQKEGKLPSEQIKEKKRYKTRKI